MGFFDFDARSRNAAGSASSRSGSGPSRARIAAMPAGSMSSTVIAERCAQTFSAAFSSRSRVVGVGSGPGSSWTENFPLMPKWMWTTLSPKT